METLSLIVLVAAAIGFLVSLGLLFKIMRTEEF